MNLTQKYIYLNLKNCIGYTYSIVYWFQFQSELTYEINIWMAFKTVNYKCKQISIYVANTNSSSGLRQKITRIRNQKS
jgi:hypothetical protein